ncbi:MAG TPA: hypothetical protein VKD65_09795 [Candidatus Angelobacter sp.]|nr:hypothetical protein [Candidatus Angelobacter sp.]
MTSILFNGRVNRTGLGYTGSMIRQIAPQFFTLDIPGTLDYYEA